MLRLLNAPEPPERLGASNRQLPPNEWAAMKVARTASGPAFAMPNEFNG